MSILSVSPVTRFTFDDDWRPLTKPSSLKKPSLGGKKESPSKYKKQVRFGQVSQKVNMRKMLMVWEAQCTSHLMTNWGKQQLNYHKSQPKLQLQPYFHLIQHLFQTIIKYVVNGCTFLNLTQLQSSWSWHSTGTACVLLYNVYFTDFLPCCPAVSPWLLAIISQVWLHIWCS